MAFGDQLVSEKGRNTIVVHAFGNGSDRIVGKVEGIYLYLSVPYTCEIDRFRIGTPDKSIHIRFESFAGKSFFARFEIHHHEPVLVGFVSVAFHTLPSDVFTIRWVLRVGVVSFVFFGYVYGLLGVQIINIDIGIGRDGVCQSGFLAASICHFIRSSVPSQLFDATPRFHRAFVGFTIQYVDNIRDCIAIEIGHKRMRGGGYPFVPMFVHQIGDDDACCLG